MAINSQPSAAGLAAAPLAVVAGVTTLCASLDIAIEIFMGAKSH